MKKLRDIVKLDSTYFAQNNYLDYSVLLAIEHVKKDKSGEQQSTTIEDTKNNSMF